MKRITALLVLLALLISSLTLVSCSENVEPTDSSYPDTSSEPTDSSETDPTISTDSSTSEDPKPTVYIDPPISERDYYIEGDPLPDMYITENGERIDGVCVERTWRTLINLGGGEFTYVDDESIWMPFPWGAADILKPFFEDENLATLYSSKLDSYSVFCGDEKIKFTVIFLDDEYCPSISFTSENIDEVQKGKYMAYASGIFLKASTPDYPFKGGSYYDLFFWFVVE